MQTVAVPGTGGRYVQMTFPLSPLDYADWDFDGLPDISGAFIQYIRVKATNSDLWRDSSLGDGEEARLAYEALPEEQRGALVYQRQTAGGLLVEIQDDANQTAREKYQTLPEEKRGPILYYVKEVPRIAEVQIWARGDNYSLQPEKRGGASFEHGKLGAPDLATDGLYDSQWTANTWSPVYEKGTAWYDLGAVFWVDNISVVNKRINQSNKGAFLGPDILVSDGTLLKPLNMKDRADFTQLEEGLKWDNIISEEHIDNRTPPVVRIFQEDFALRKIRFLQVRDLDITGIQSGRYGALATIAEIQLYGEGYPVSVWAYSPPISLTDSRGNFIRKTLPRIAWEGDVLIRDIDPLTGQATERIEPLDLHPDVRLQVQTRTSDQTDTNFTYYQVISIAGNEEREEVTKEAYDEIALQVVGMGDLADPARQQATRLAQGRRWRRCSTMKIPLTSSTMTATDSSMKTVKNCAEHRVRALTRTASWPLSAGARGARAICPPTASMRRRSPRPIRANSSKSGSISPLRILSRRRGYESCGLISHRHWHWSWPVSWRW